MLRSVAPSAAPIFLPGQNVPAKSTSQPYRLAARERSIFMKKRGFKQPKEMPAHVVGAEREEERRAHPVLRERLEQARDAFARAAKRVDVDAQAERAYAHGALLADAFAAPVRGRVDGACAGAASRRSM